MVIIVAEETAGFAPQTRCLPLTTRSIHCGLNTPIGWDFDKYSMELWRVDNFLIQFKTFAWFLLAIACYI